MCVIGRVGHRHGAGQGHLHRPAGFPLQELQVFHHDGPGAPDGGHAAAHHGLAAAVANPFFRQGLVVKALHVHGDVGEVGCASLFPVANDIKASSLLVMNRHAHGIVLGLM